MRIFFSLINCGNIMVEDNEPVKLTIKKAGSLLADPA